jgi:hypothetical protein
MIKPDVTPQSNFVIKSQGCSHSFHVYIILSRYITKPKGKLANGATPKKVRRRQMARLIGTQLAGCKESGKPPKPATHNRRQTWHFYPGSQCKAKTDPVPPAAALSISNWNKPATRPHFILLMIERVQAFMSNCARNEAGQGLEKEKWGGLGAQKGEMGPGRGPKRKKWGR